MVNPWGFFFCLCMDRGFILSPCPVHRRGDG
nr:MAG TPA: hypothetical protein [Caudoviricetes sp.]